jgi:hypothetical protein
MTNRALHRLIFLIVFNGVALLSWGTTYYVHPELGNDDHSGTHLLAPFKSLKKISTLNLKAGDEILLAAGYTFDGTLRLDGQKGASDHPIRISSYQWANSLEDPRAIIDAGQASNGIHLNDCSHIIVEHLIIQADGKSGDADLNMRCGVLVTTSRPGFYQNIQLHQLLVQDIFIEAPGFERGAEEVRTANGRQRYGWGIRFINQTEGAILKNLIVQDCVIKNVAHTGIKFTSRGQNIFDIQVQNNRVLKSGGPGIQMSGVRFGHIRNNYVHSSGSVDDSRKWGRGSGLWTWSSSDILIEHNHFLYANGPGDSAGCHIDFNCRNVVVQYNFSAHNVGGFCEILGNNYNCAYRYNISVNDGHRVKGEDGAFQEGKTFWLSGYVGKNRKRKGPFNSYFYNNTIYVSKEIVSKMAVSKVAEGVLIANNIFYIEGKSKAVKGDQYVPEQAGVAQVSNIFFQNNLFLRTENWPTDIWIQDSHKHLGDPQFTQNGGLNVWDYIPRNEELVKNKGVEIPHLPNDPIGLTIGLRPAYDILGNQLQGKPDLGAIELR